jgi:hypothetical protein
MVDSLAQLYLLTFFNVLIPGAASRVNLAVSDRPRLALDRCRCRLWVKSELGGKASGMSASPPDNGQSTDHRRINIRQVPRGDVGPFHLLTSQV